MPDFETAISTIEENLRHFGTNCKFQKTGSPNIYCTTLPPHWRSNKSLPSPFVVLLLSPVADGTRVTVTAGNEENDTADVKNHVAEVNKQIARFSDLRFVGKSGRGKNFNLTITIHHQNDYREIAVVPSVIKVTVDGPRDSRNASKSPYNPHSHPSYDYHRKRPASMNPFDLSLNLGHPIPSTSALLDLANPAKRFRLSQNSSANNIPQNPILQNNNNNHGNEFYKTSQISMPSLHHHLLPSHLHNLPTQQPMIFNPNLMMAAAAAAAMNQQQQQAFQIPPNLYATYLTTLYAAALSSMNPPPSSDTSSASDDVKLNHRHHLTKVEAEEEDRSECKSASENHQSQKSEEKKVWRPFFSAE